VFTEDWGNRSFEALGEEFAMKAAQVVKYGDAVEGIELREIPEPAAPKSGEALVGVEFSPINFNDLMVIWGIWWKNAFWFSTGPRTRKARNITENAHCVIGTEKADEAVIVEGLAEQIIDRGVWKEFAARYDKKYGGELLPLLESSGGAVFRIVPQVAFGQDEHAENFVQSATRWKFPNV